MSLHPFLTPGIILVIAVLLALIARFGLGSVLLRWAQKTESDLDDHIVLAMRNRLFWLVLLLGAWEAIGVLHLPADSFAVELRLPLLILVVALISLLCAAVLNASYRLLSLRHPQLVQGSSLITGMLYTVTGLIGLMVILNLLGISIAPALAALGVGGLAIALALQDTLGNLLAGVYIILAKRVRVGDYVRVEGNFEGTIQDITWRHTTLLQLNNNLVIMPNTKMSQSIVVNFTINNPQLTHSIPVSVPYDTDLVLLEHVVKEEAILARADTEALVPSFDPVFRLNPGFGASSLDCSLIVEITSFEKQYEVSDVIRRRLVARFRSEGLSFASPMMMVVTKPH